MFLRNNGIQFTVLLLVIVIIVFGTSISAQETVKVGIIHALTGPPAIMGQDNLNGCLLAIDIINGEFPDLPFDLAPKAGLPNLNDAKIEPIIGNSQGEPEFGAAEAERLITLAGVSAILGANLSGVTKTASLVAEKYQTPFLTETSTARDLTERGFKYFFRTTISDHESAEQFMIFFEELNREMNANIKTIGYCSANSEWGISDGKSVAEFAEKYGFEVVANLSWPEATADLDSEVLTLKRANPDVVISAILGTDFVLFVDTAKKLDYNPKMFLGFGGGFFTSMNEIGKDAESLLVRHFMVDISEENTPLLYKVNQMYKDRYGNDLHGDSIRNFTAMMCLGDAINRAGSTDKEAIREALTKTDIPADQLIINWDGIKFNEKGQNVLGKGIIRQWLDGRYQTTWPFDIATAEIVFPMPKWSEK